MGVGENYDWKNEAAYQTMKNRGNGCCSDECSIKQEEKLAQENQKKCADCQNLKKPDELLTIQDQGKEIKVCADCKQKRDDNPEIPRKDKDDNSEPVSLEGEDIYCENCDK